MKLVYVSESNVLSWDCFVGFLMLKSRFGSIVWLWGIVKLEIEYLVVCRLDRSVYHHCEYRLWMGVWSLVGNHDFCCEYNLWLRL